MTRCSYLLAVLGSLTLAACGEHPQAPAAAQPTAAVSQPAEAGTPATPAEPKAPAPRPIDVPVGREADDAARFLAGLPGKEGSAYKELEANEAWQEHAKNMDELWSLFERRRQPGMQKFQKSELTGAPVDGSPIWYPFSGGDALTMLTFFPGHSVYVMAALEPPGIVPKPEEFAPEKLEHHLNGIASTLQSLLSKSFFVTREMDRQLRGQIVDGVSIPVLIQLARLGYSVTGYRYVQVDETGKIVERAVTARRQAFGLNRGIEFAIEHEGQPPATLYYISLNLDDRHMKDNQPFKDYVGALGRPATLLKSTSYMLHEKGFSQIRDLILERSALIVQDDSGIPFQAFDDAVWNVQLYGDYVKPFGRDFQFRTQPELRAAYENGRDKVKSIDFRLGYGAGRVTSNLQVARRK